MMRNRSIFEVDLNEIDLEQFYWDAFLVVDYNQERFFVRIKNKSYLNIFNLMYRMGVNEYRLGDMVVYPYITLNLAFSLNYRPVTEYETSNLAKKDCIAFILYILIGWIYSFRKPILINEKFSHSAQDNAFYFFKYCYENHKDIPIYFIIDKNSPDTVKLRGMEDRTIDFMSLKHLLYIFVSKFIISSESKGHGFAWRINKGFAKNKINQKRFIFLQHGVIGFKVLDNTFKAWGVNHADLFIVSSKKEKEIVHRNLKYPNRLIVDTGLSRWDYLEENLDSDKTILYMPTWRNWLDTVTEEEFINSDFYNRINSFLSSLELSEFLHQSNSKIYFYLHPRIYEKQALFHIPQNERVQFVKFGEADLKYLLSQSSVVITDYSSVAWDSYYQSIPVLFYQFDLDRYLIEQGSYLDFKKEAFGPLVKDEPQLIKELEKLASNGFKIDTVFLEKREEYFSHLDKKNNQRIFEKITEIDTKKKKWYRFKHEAARNLVIKAIRFNIDRRFHGKNKLWSKRRKKIDGSRNNIKGTNK